ncbi:sulfite exporter TauE/SafE family protein [Dietzia lutea]|uniref:Probable membrane transporter protein n=1 Tax=Dietzia lutea TaxID=546160 RepID=A0A2S1R415_9ACTN|nr:sulfite exporter TauE/SafE family protein [Dietzia lutea]AWH90994.1 hypothetical protein A6035_01010 [Dietzia lutea]
MSILLLLFGILAGAVTLRVTGIGFALIAAPFFVIALGPWNALGLIHLTGVAACLVLAWRLRKEVDRRLALELGAWAALMAIPGTWLSFVVPERVLQLAIGIGLLISLAIMVSFRDLPKVDGPIVRAITGMICGAFTYTAGMGGPAMTIYSRLSHWPHQRFVATLQPMFAVLGTGGLLVRYSVSGELLPPVPSWIWVGAAAMLLGGLRVGDLLTRFISVSGARQAALLVAFGGCLVTIGQAVIG